MAAKRKTRKRVPKLKALPSIAELVKKFGPLKPFRPHVWVRHDVGLLEIALEDVSCYHEWLKGEGADTSIWRANDDTNRVVGATLPLRLKQPVSMVKDGNVPLALWNKPPRRITVQDFRDFIAGYGQDVAVLVTWTHEDLNYTFTTAGASSQHADIAVNLRDSIAHALKLFPLRPSTEDLRGDHPNVGLNEEQINFLLWVLGRLYGERNKMTQAHARYVDKYHFEVLDALGKAKERGKNRPQ